MTAGRYDMAYCGVIITAYVGNEQEVQQRNSGEPGKRMKFEIPRFTLSTPNSSHMGESSEWPPKTISTWITAKDSKNR
jgi:hypothetical protein